MRKAESLNRLSLWAMPWPTTNPTALSPERANNYRIGYGDARDAELHGSAAVRAIREIRGYDPETFAVSRIGLEETFNFCYVVREARLAVRAALSAVGIHGPL